MVHTRHIKRGFSARAISALVRIRATLAAVAIFGVLASGLTAVPAAAAPTAVAPAAPAAVAPVLAADLSQFRPGNIISNEVFFNSSTMSEADIAKFLQQRVPNCQAGYVCLKDFRQNTATRAADSFCDTYQGGANESAALIIYKVAQACGINPQVILATLQKEQGLVTHTWPSDWRYTIAMGQGCPDTAACDTRYYGFYNQVIGAARQFQIYSANTYFTYYAPGKTWNVLYNPNRNCGSSPVYIENQATSNLYYYTPYQPNAAALKAGLGEGDGCSAYGNRNFYNYFSDWFGSTQSSTTALVRTAADSTVWLVNNGSRWRIGNFEDYAELAGVFGGASIVGQSFISAMTPGGDAGAVLRDAGTGTISLVQSGQLHRLPSCEAVADFGASCTSPVNVTSALLSRVPAGADVGGFFRVRGGERWGRFEEARAVTPLYNVAAARAVNGNVHSTPYAPYLNTDVYAAAPKRANVFAPAQLVKSSTDAKVYLTVGFDALAHVPSFASVAEYNRTIDDLAVVPTGDLSGYTASGTVAPLLTCGPNTFYPAAGWLYRLSDPARTGLASFAGGDSTCAQFSQREGVVTGDLAIKTAESSDVWIVAGAERRPALSWASLVSHNGGAAPTVVTVARNTRDSLPEGAPVARGMVVKAAASPELLFAGDVSTHWIRSAGLAADFGISLDYRVLTPTQLTALPRGAALSSWVQCGTTTYFAAERVLWPVTAPAARGFAPTTLDAGACATLSRSTTTLGVVAVKTNGSSDVSVASEGRLRYVTSWDALVRLNGGTAPRILTVSSDALREIPAGTPVS